jgi:CTP synthase
MHLETKIDISWIDAADLEDALECEKVFEGIQGILVPGGFGERGIKGKLKAIRYARENQIPFFGICLGMQLAVIEATRNIANIDDATSSELDPHSGTHVVGLMTEWEKEGTLLKRSSQCDLGGTMRLGSYPCALQKGSLAEKAYGESNIQERHRHRYEVNLYFKDVFEKAGIVFSGMSPDGVLPEIIERNDHPWFVAVQFHPEFKSKPLTPHPLFVGFVKAALILDQSVEILKTP